MNRTAMKILLIQPPLEDFYTTSIRLYPLGLLYAADVLLRFGCEVKILDCLNPLQKRSRPLPPLFTSLRRDMEENPYFFKGYYRFGLEAEEILRRVADFSPDAIGVSSQFTAYYSSVEELVRLIKGRYPVPIFVGGHHATYFAQQLRARTPEIDAVICGPAEESLPPFLMRLGLRPLQPLIPWTEIETPHGLLPDDAYGIGRRRMASMIGSRGCPHGCAYCSVQRMFGRSQVRRGVDGIMKEMRRLVLERGVAVVNFEDDNLSCCRQWFAELLDAVIRDAHLDGVELTAMNGLCYTSLDESILALMRRAGFKRLNISLVTRDPRLRRRLGRPEKGCGIQSVIKAAHRLGFAVTVYVIIGLPGQSYGEVRGSIDEVLELGVLVGPSIYYLAPGSSLYRDLGLEVSWELHRSTAFFSISGQLSQRQAIELFTYTRRRNKSRNGSGESANNATVDESAYSRKMVRSRSEPTETI